MYWQITETMKYMTDTLILTIILNYLWHKYLIRQKVKELNKEKYNNIKQNNNESIISYPHDNVTLTEHEKTGGICTSTGMIGIHNYVHRTNTLKAPINPKILYTFNNRTHWYQVVQNFTFFIHRLFSFNGGRPSIPVSHTQFLCMSMTSIPQN